MQMLHELASQRVVHPISATSPHHHPNCKTNHPRLSYCRGLVLATRFRRSSHQLPPALCRNHQRRGRSRHIQERPGLPSHHCRHRTETASLIPDRSRECYSHHRRSVDDRLLSSSLGWGQRGRSSDGVPCPACEHHEQVLQHANTHTAHNHRNPEQVCCQLQHSRNQVHWTLMCRRE